MNNLTTAVFTMMNPHRESLTGMVRVECSNTFKSKRKNKMRNDRKFKNQKQSRNFF
jgi:hypothetical protein